MILILGRFRTNGSDRIYELTDRGIVHITGYEGAVRAALFPGWTDDEWCDTIFMPPDVEAWLQSL